MGVYSMSGFPWAVRQFLFGALVSLGAVLTVVKFFPADRQREQRIVACFFSGITGTVMILSAAHGRFSENGGWVLLPIALIAPLLYIIELSKREKRKK